MRIYVCVQMVCRTKNSLISCNIFLVCCYHCNWLIVNEIAFSWIQIRKKLIQTVWSMFFSNWKFCDDFHMAHYRSRIHRRGEFKWMTDSTSATTKNWIFHNAIVYLEARPVYCKVFSFIVGRYLGYFEYTKWFIITRDATHSCSCPIIESGSGN